MLDSINQFIDGVNELVDVGRCEIGGPLR